MTVLVTGASGLLGQLVVEALAARGTPVRGMGRGALPPSAAGEWRQADLLTGAGLADAVAGVTAVVHCASDPRRPADDLTMLANLIEAMHPTDAHLVYVGIAGIEEAAAVLPYYRMKLACERRLIESKVPHTICRATQFHPFVARVLDRLGWGPFQLCPAMRLQPVDPRFVAERLADLCIAEPKGRSADLSGPEHLSNPDLVTPWLRVHRYRRLRLPLPSVGVLSAWTRLRPIAGEAGGIDWREWLYGRSAEWPPA